MPIQTCLVKRRCNFGPCNRITDFTASAGRSADSLTGDPFWQHPVTYIVETHPVYPPPRDALSRSARDRCRKALRSTSAPVYGPHEISGHKKRDRDLAQQGGASQRKCNEFRGDSAGTLPATRAEIADGEESHATPISAIPTHTCPSSPSHRRASIHAKRGRMSARRQPAPGIQERWATPGADHGDGNAR